MLFWLYNALVLPAAAVYLLVFALSRRRVLLKNLPAELGQRTGIYPADLLARLSGRPLVWFHAASLGETRALAPLIARLRRERPEYALVLTSSNVIARDQGAALPGIDASFLAPIDFYPFTVRALRAFSPRALVIAESELWPSLLRAARARGVKTAVANARISRRSFRRLRRLRSVLSWMYEGLDLVAAQTPADARRFAELGARADRVIVSGNLKYDGFFSESVDLAPLRARVARLGWRPEDAVLVAGSTHGGEEEAVLRAFAAVQAAVPRARLLLAPRHLERLNEVEALLRREQVPFARWTELDGAAAAPSDVLLLDTVGILPGLYGLARAAFVGGTLAPRGGHNLLEPVRFSVPVVFGPYIDNVRDIAGLLATSGGGIEVRDADELSTTLEALFQDPARCAEAGRGARRAVERLLGATDRTLHRLRPLLGKP